MFARRAVVVAFAVSCIAVWATWTCPDAVAGLRVQRTLDWRNGLPNSFTDQVEQDPAGFLWINTPSGIFRYDGSEVTQVTSTSGSFIPGSIRAGHPLVHLSGSTGSRALCELDGSPVSGPEGEAFRASNAAQTADGALWARTDSGLFRRLAEDWKGPFAAPSAVALRAGPWMAEEGGVLASTADELFRFSAHGDVQRIGAALGVISAVELPDRTVFALCWRKDGGHVLAIHADGSVREVEHSSARPMSIAVRGRIVWVAYDNRLVRVVEGEPNDVISPAQGYPGGGSLFVDAEGSLWLASFVGLVQYPEPETVSLLDRFRVGSRFMSPLANGFWMSSWTGALVGRRVAGRIDLAMEPGTSSNPACHSSDGAVWTVVTDGFARFDGDEPPSIIRVPGPRSAYPCLLDSAGFTWFPTDDGLYSLAPGGSRPVKSTASFPETDDVQQLTAIAEDRSGEIWLGRGSRVCHAPARELQAGSLDRWSCETVPGSVRVDALREMPGGDLWATGWATGVMRRHDGRWEEVPGTKTLGSRITYGPIPSPAGGFWIVGQGNCLRVEERPDLPDGWKVLERVGMWQGLPGAWTMDLFEETDGALWLATDAGLTHVTPESRQARPAPPPVAIVEVTSDGKAIEPGGHVDLPYRTNRLEFRFAALSYREPGLIRFRTRLHRNDPWSAAGKDSKFQFVDLAPGHYEIEAEASLDGERWSPAPASLEVEVLRPWWRTGWFYSVCAASLAILGTLAYRVRVGQLLRLERQRTRIAMDLHDAIGSGLGSIRLLSGLAGRETTPEAARTELASRISTVSEELATSLGDIVWSLRPGSGTLESLGTQLLSRGGALFEASETELGTEFPVPWPDVRLSLAVRRHVFLIGLEAMHNAARHARAGRVLLALERAGRRWRLRVEDDGRGLGGAERELEGADREPDPGHGLGFESIRKRAAEIGATAAWVDRDSGGTVFTLEFDAGADDRRTLEQGGEGPRDTVSPVRATGNSGPEVAD